MWLFKTISYNHLYSLQNLTKEDRDELFQTNQCGDRHPVLPGDCRVAKQQFLPWIEAVASRIQNSKFKVQNGNPFGFIR
jgi:hypothetical protein